MMYAGAADGSLVTFVVIPMVPTSRGSVQLASRNAADSPLIDPNYFPTAVDRYIAKEGVKLQLNFASGDKTNMGRERLDGEVGAQGSNETLSVSSSDEYIDARLRVEISTSYHPVGTAAMGKVVDNDLNVKGVKRLRIVDASVFPVTISGHLQVAKFAMAEQAAVIIYANRRVAE